MGTIAAVSDARIVISDASAGATFFIETDGLSIEPADTSNADAALATGAVDTVGLHTGPSPAEADRALVNLATRRAVGSKYDGRLSHEQAGIVSGVRIPTRPKIHDFVKLVHELAKKPRPRVRSSRACIRSARPPSPAPPALKALAFPSP